MVLRRSLTALFNKSIFKISVKKRLLIYFLILVMIPVSIISVSLYQKAVNIINNNINHMIRNNLGIIETGIMKKLSTVNDITNTIYLNSQLVDILSSPPPQNRIDTINEVATLDKILESYNIYNTTNLQLIPSIYLYNRPEFPLFSFSDRVYNLGSIEATEWYRKIPAENNYTVTGLNTKTVSLKTLHTIRIAKKLYGIKSTDIPFAGLLTVDIDINEFTELLKENMASSKDKIFIFDNTGSIVVSSDQELLAASTSGFPYIRKISGISASYGMFNTNINKQDMIVAFKKMPQINWTIVALSPTSELFGDFAELKKLMYIVLVLSTIIAFLLSNLLSENISYPIRKLIKSMSSIKDGNLDVQLDYKRNDEFADLVNTYRIMIGQIKDLISRLYITEKSKRESDLKALQSQINPHFLYNTLDSVNLMAIKCNVPEISTMVTSLADFFRYSLNKGKNIITLAEEFKQVESYLRIQKIRFRDRFDYHISFPPGIKHYLTVKLILQPLVENSLLHGIEKNDKKGFISISARKTGSVIQIEVKDNGKGADPDELNGILQSSDISSRAFGVRNVNERIKRFSGEEYGLAYKNNDDSEGITAIITISATTKLEGYNVKSDHSG